MGVFETLRKVGSDANFIRKAANSVYHAGAAGIDMLSGDQKSAKENAGASGWNAVKAVPGVGTLVGLAEAMHDSDPDPVSATDPHCVAPYTGDDGSEHCYDHDGNDINYGPADERTLQQKFTDWIIPYEAETSRMADPDEPSFHDDDGAYARRTDRFLTDQIDGLGEWLGILDPKDEDDSPVSVPM